MNFSLLLLTCLVAYVTSDCPDGSTLVDYSSDKCFFDLVFRGNALYGGSSMSQDGPDVYIQNRYDKFSLNQVYKGSLSQGQSVFVTFRRSSNDPCPISPYGDGGAEKVVFALRNQTTGLYYVLPCSNNPAYACIDQDAFEAVQCSSPVAA